MVNNKRIFVRVTANQFERIRNNAHAKGFKTISAYVRSLTLRSDLIFEKKFNELYAKIVKSDFNDNIGQELS